jgi:hypothetical protein
MLFNHISKNAGRTMANQKRAGTHTVGTQLAMAAAKPPEPPAWITLPPEAVLVWDSIVRARDYTSWTSIDLEHAANLACCLADLERLRREVRDEGDTLRNERGTMVVNPKHSLIEVLSRRSVALSRMLHVHAEATTGESRHQKQRSQKQRHITESIEATGGDDLIARPH